MKKQQCFTLPQGMSVDDFRAMLADGHILILEHSFRSSWRIYDSFDWRLFKRGLMLRLDLSQKL